MIGADAVGGHGGTLNDDGHWPEGRWPAAPLEPQTTLVHQQCCSLPFRKSMTVSVGPDSPGDHVAGGPNDRSGHSAEHWASSKGTGRIPMKTTQEDSY